MSGNGRDPKTGQFLTGSVGNPAGRPKGSRNKLGEAFVQDFLTVWKEGGIDAVRRVMMEDPGKFCQIAAGLLPKDVTVKHEAGEDFLNWIKTIETAARVYEQSESGKDGGAATRSAPVRH